MAVTTIPWGDGSGGNIYLTYPSASGDQSVSVTSDANTGAARSKVVTFTSGVGSITRQLTVAQDAGSVEHTLTLYPYSYIPKTEDGSWNSLVSIANAYDDVSTTNYGSISMTQGAYAETWIYFLFDTSGLPSNATIVSAQLQAKGYGGGNSTSVPTKNMSVYHGSTQYGTVYNLGSSTPVRTWDLGSLTAAELKDLRLRLYSVRGSNGTTNYNLRLYGATLTITYRA